MAQTMTVPAKTFTEILSRLDRLTRDVQAIKTKLSGKEPPYGSEEWWEWSDKKAMEDIKAGRVVTFDSAEKQLNGSTPKPGFYREIQETV